MKKHSFKLEPIYHFDKMIACELLTVMENKNDSTIEFIKSLNGFQREIFLNRQILAILSIKDFLQKRNLLISINIDYPLAVTLLQSPFLMELIRNIEFIRIEVSENFAGLRNIRENMVIKKLSKNFILWLDDFGNGEASLDVALSGCFDCIKVDKEFFWCYSKKEIFPALIGNMIKFMGKIIIEGIETPEHLNIIKSHNYYGAQGHIYDTLEVSDSLNKHGYFYKKTPQH